MTDATAAIQETVINAIKNRTPLRISAGGSKTFLSPQIKAVPLSIAQHSGIINYQPTELVLTARAGTKLTDIEILLAEHQQILPFEPPHFSDNATLGGTIAAGLSGSIRPFTGSARDFILGCRIINGKGEILQFGGQVMKNVAGYDVSRLMVGAMGTLGILLDISIKVLPKFPAQCCLIQPRETDDALRLMQTLTQQNLPLSGLAFDGEHLHLRLSGAEAAVSAARKKLGGQETPASAFWQTVRDQTHHFFDGNNNLWRLSVPPATPMLNLPGKQLIDWAGGLRWVKTTDSAAHLFKVAAKYQGHATLFSTQDSHISRMQPLSPTMMRIHENLKSSFDPYRIFNPGLLYPTL